MVILPQKGSTYSSSYLPFPFPTKKFCLSWSRLQYWVRSSKESALLWNGNIWSEIWPTRGQSSCWKQRGHFAHQGKMQCWAQLIVPNYQLCLLFTPRMIQLPFQSHESSPNPMPHGNRNFTPILGGWRANNSHLSPSQGDHSHYDTVLWKSRVRHNSVWTVPRGNCSVF